MQSQSLTQMMHSRATASWKSAKILSMVYAVLQNCLLEHILQAQLKDAKTGRADLAGARHRVESITVWTLTKD